MRSRLELLPIVILDVANVGSAKNLSLLFPSYYKHLRKARVRTASGGRKFKTELSKSKSLLPLFIELSRLNLIYQVDDKDVDAEQSRFEQIILDCFGKPVKECDDPHLFALSKLANCKTVISSDKRIATCKKCLRASKIENSQFANPVLVSSDAQYMKRFNKKAL